MATEALTGGRGRQAFFSTCVHATAEQVLSWYAMRWSMEVMNHDSKQHLDFQEPQSWTRCAVERTAPVAMLLSSLIVLWFARSGHQEWHPRAIAWYTAKSHVSFADMLHTLKQLSLQQQISQLAVQRPGLRKLRSLIENTVLMTT